MVAVRRSSRPSFRLAAVCSAALLWWLLLSPRPAASQGMGLNRTEQETHDKQVETVGPERPDKFDWPWGELFYDRTYTSDLLVTNDCSQPRPVYAWVGSGIAPYLTIAKVTTVPARTKDFRVPITITTPPPPAIVGPPPPLPAGIFVDIAERPLSRLRLEHRADQTCRAPDKIYDVTGHIHYDPDPAGTGPETDACGAIWNSGVPLPGYDLEQCRDRFHELLAHYRDTILAPAMEADPAAWAWFPSDDAIGGMTARETLDAKLRAQRQRAGQAAA